MSVHTSSTALLLQTQQKLATVNTAASFLQPTIDCCTALFITTGHYPWILWASVLVAIQWPYLYIVKRLLAVKDVLSMGAEIARSLIAFDVFAGAYFVLLAFMDTGYIQFDTRIHVLLIVMLAHSIQG